LTQAGETLNVDTVRNHMATKGDPIREYLTGDVLGMVRELLDRAAATSGARLRSALYELSDQELSDAIIAAAAETHLVLSNSGKGEKTGKWDEENRPVRLKLHKTAGLDVQDRMFNNGHIGHNKFVTYENNTPQAVMTGSTNWTPTGLCGQSNNAILVESADLAAQYAQ
jgi:phosphatidylserine/phosphatidylglycerophosphate/cardiolipin synthase-like enzyme